MDFWDVVSWVTSPVPHPDVVEWWRDEVIDTLFKVDEPDPRDGYDGGQMLGSPEINWQSMPQDNSNNGGTGMLFRPEDVHLSPSGGVDGLH